MNWYLKVLKQYADFNGRARRTEYWMFSLFNFIVFFVLELLMITLSFSLPALAGVLALLLGIYALAIIIPCLAVMVRRLHDIGKSGCMIFICLIPAVGGIWLFVLTLLDSQPGSNRYGANPKEIKD